MEQDVVKYWSGVAADYAKTAYQNEERYPFYQVRLNLALDMLKGCRPGKILDAGCGGGKVLLEFLAKGWDGYGVDASPNMVALAKQNLQGASHEVKRIYQSSVTDLSMFADESFDVVISLGVMEYLPPAEEKKAFAETRRVLKRDGIFLVENINNLFDLGTFNRFTIRFYQEHFFSKFSKDEQQVADLTRKLESLVTYPAKPDKKGGFSTTRDQVFTKAEIPLTYGKKVRGYGFVEKEQAFYRFHAAPPLFFESQPALEKVALDFELQYSRDWIGNFLASGFISYLTKDGV